MIIIDLSQLIYDNMDVYDGDPPVKIEKIHEYEEKTWQLSNISMGSHTGTHVDAFSHMHPSKETLEDIPIERFFGTAQVVDVNDKYPKNIGLFFIEKVSITQLERILQAKPALIGGEIDEDLERALLDNNILTYTNLVNLELIPKKTNFMFFGLPLNIKEGDGSPVRAIAIID